MGVTREYALDEVHRFNAWYIEQDEETQSHFVGPSMIEDYEVCRLCGENEFRPFEEGDCPDGCTIGPVIYE
jgi:hypothetical protein